MDEPGRNVRHRAFEDDKVKFGIEPLDARYGPGFGVTFRRMRRPPATSIAEFETNTGK